MYGKIFESIYDGTLADHWQALITFQQMIVLCNPDGIIDMTVSAISRRTGIPAEHIEEGIRVLESEDPQSRTDGEGGRRIVRIDDHRPWGWRIVNHAYYKRLASRDDKRRADRERVAAKRANNKDVAECRELSQGVADVAHADADADNTPPTPPEGDERATPPSWKTDYEIYKNKCRDSYRSLLADKEWVNQQSRLNPGVNIPLTMEKAALNHWSTKEAWQKKKRQKIKTINWKSTWQNAISSRQNRVYNDAVEKSALQESSHQPPLVTKENLKEHVYGN